MSDEVSFSYKLCHPTDPAEIAKLSSEYEVIVQQSVTLHCEAKGNPQPIYTWIPCDPERSVCHESRLHISQVLKDSVYLCKATNILGTDARHVRLGKTLITIWQCADHRISLGTNLHLVYVIGLAISPCMK